MLNTQTPQLEVAALVLVGGQSSRMGQDKALLPWQGQPLLQRVCRVAASCCQPIYLLTPWPERYQHLDLPNPVWLTETQLGGGPLLALHQGLNQIPEAWVLLLACDMPRLKPELLQTWQQQLSELPPEIMALVPRQGNQWEPLCGFYRRQAQMELQQFIAGGGRSFQTWLPTIAVQSLELNAETADSLWNCNTPGDLGLCYQNDAAAKTE